MAINIDDFTDGAKFNTRQWISILQSANELIDYRKQKLLNSINNKQNIEISNLVNNLVKKEIEVQDLQKKVLEQTEKINSQYNKEEITNMTNVFAEVNKLSQNPDYLRAVADAIHKENSKKKPQDHKKSQKKATSNFVETEFKEVMSDGE
jgi:alanyl-tRNA synthetase